MAAEHEHSWNLVMHLDGCHFYQSSYTCASCPATRITSDERDQSYDPYTTVWFDEQCERCAELRGGALPKSVDEIELPT
jgi:hypothetical protein